MTLIKKSFPVSFLSRWYTELASKQIKVKHPIRFYALVVFLSLIMLAALVAAYIDYQLLVPKDMMAEPAMFEIEQGMGMSEIAQSLDDQELIRSKMWFELYAYFRGWSGGLQAGKYMIGANSNIKTIASQIFYGDVLPNSVKVTIPEGFTLDMIDKRLSQIGLIEPGDILEFASLEGYLFPDTYIFERDMAVQDIVDMMTENLDDKLEPSLMAEIDAQGKTIHEILTMASIIEKEVALYNDKRIVSGIFWSRIADNYPLQSCATIAYILGVNKWRYSIEDTKVDSPYNTYQNKGLPPGPINNPGLLSIKAAIFPISTNYYFFLSAPDGTTIYSQTFEEHQANKDKYLGL